MLHWSQVPAAEIYISSYVNTDAAIMLDDQSDDSSQHKHLQCAHTKLAASSEHNATSYQGAQQLHIVPDKCWLVCLCMTVYKHLHICTMPSLWCMYFFLSWRIPARWVCCNVSAQLSCYLKAQLQLVNSAVRSAATCQLSCTLSAQTKFVISAASCWLSCSVSAQV